MSSSSVPEPAFVGKTLAHFRVLAKLGQGGMGVVYRAEDERLRRPVALKVLPPDRSADPQRRARLLREARAAAALTHPNIAVVYEVDEADGHVYIAMELVEGRSLKRSSEGPMPPAQVLALARQIAAGLARAHQGGVVHRDLKPDNLIVDDFGQLKILDFGLAKLGTAPNDPTDEPTVSSVTEEGRVLGTPGYMSPEQARGAEVDARSDVFAFGVVLYELLTGERPFVGDTPLDVMAAITRDTPLAPSRRNIVLPAWLDSLVMRCLEKDPARRPADGRQLVAELERPAPANTGSGRRRGIWLALGVAAIVAAAGGWAWRRSSASAPPHHGDQSTSEAEALSSYRAALDDMLAGSTARASKELDDALRREPELAPASLRVALNRGVLAPVREHFRQARALRSRLDEHDQALLDASEPCLAEATWDWAECERRLGAASARFSSDEELAYEHGLALSRLGRHAEARSVLAHAFELDPRSLRSLALSAAEALELGDLKAARTDADRCLLQSPGATACSAARALTDEVAGDCQALDNDAERAVAAAPQNVIAYHLLARARAALGQLDGARQVLTRRAELVPDNKRKEAQLNEQIHLALLGGDFNRAEASAVQLGAAIATFPVETDHARLVLWRLDILGETGRTGEAAKMAQAYAERRRTLLADPHDIAGAILNDPTPLLLEAELRGGTLKRSEAARRRDAWLADWQKRVPPPWAAYLWIRGYASTARTSEEALEALAALPRFLPLPSLATAGVAEAEVGRVYLLADRAAEALPLLERAVGSCRDLEFPVELMRATLDLGEARAQTGNRRGACEAWKRVVDRWGAAQPPSRTAQSARDRWRQLGCEKAAAR